MKIKTLNFIRPFSRSAERASSLCSCLIKTFFLLLLLALIPSMIQAQVIDKKEKKAFSKYLKAANKGDTAMQKKVAYCLLKGIGVYKDTAQAVSWFTKVAEQGDIIAQYNLGYLYSQGNSIRNYEESAKWYSKAAEKGDVISQIKLGMAYIQGKGVSKNDSLAFLWIKKGAEGGNAFAQNWIGTAYCNGQGVSQNFEEGAKWYEKSARQGNVNAILNLAKCYESGIGVTKAMDKAALWMELAAKQGNEQAKIWYADYSSKKKRKEKIITTLNEAKSMKTRPNIYKGRVRELPSSDVVKMVRVWQKKGNDYIYNGAKTYGWSRFHGRNEGYSDPYDSCLPNPYSKVSFTVNPNSITFRFEDAIQVDCTFKRVKTAWGTESDDPVRPSDAMRQNFGCKGGAAKYIGTMRNGNKTLKICVHNTCTHKIYQTFRTNKLRGSYSNGIAFEYAAIEGSSADPYAPWRQVHKQTTVINLAECAKLNGMTKKEFVKELLDCNEWFVNKTGSMLVLDDEASAVMFYFLWNTFGFKLPQ